MPFSPLSSLDTVEVQWQRSSGSSGQSEGTWPREQSVAGLGCDKRTEL
jgi:hypothetical protein